MSGFNKSDNTIANGIPARRTGPQTGADVDERRSFAPARPDLRRTKAENPLDADEHAPAQQIADGGDRLRYDDDDLNDSKGG